MHRPLPVPSARAGFAPARFAGTRRKWPPQAPAAASTVWRTLIDVGSWAGADWRLVMSSNRSLDSRGRKPVTTGNRARMSNSTRTAGLVYAETGACQVRAGATQRHWRTALTSACASPADADKHSAEKLDRRGILITAPSLRALSPDLILLTWAEQPMTE